MQSTTNHVQGQNSSWAEFRLKFALKLREAQGCIPAALNNASKARI